MTATTTSSATAAAAAPGPTRGEEGAMSIMAALATIIALLGSVLAIDLGSHVFAQRDMQGAVDLAALDAVMALSAGGDPATLADDYARESLRRNDGWANRDGRDVTVTVGTFDPATRTFTPTTFAPDAVLVEAEAQFARLTGILPGADRVAHRAVASTLGQASLSIGTSVASLDSDRGRVTNRVLSRLLGRSSDFSLDLVGWQGLARGTVSVRRLAADLGVASPEELMDTTVSVRRLLEAGAEGLSASGDPLDVAAATPLSTLAAEVGTAAQVRVGDLLALDAGVPGAVADLQVQALDLVAVAAQVVNGTNVVTLDLPVAVPGVGTGQLTLAVIEPPQLAAGRPGIDPATGTWRTVARTAQVRLGVDLQLTDLDLDTVRTSALDVPVVVEAGRGEAPLESVTCVSGDLHPYVGVPVRTSAVTTTIGDLPPDLVTATTPVPLDPADVGTVSIDAPLLGSLDLGTLTASLQDTVGAASEDLTFTGPYAESQRTAGASTLGGTPRVPGSEGDGRVGLAAAFDSADLGVSALVAGVDLQADVLDPVLDGVTPVLDEVDRRVVGPLLESLGVSLGRADVTVAGVECGGRWLVQ